MRETFRLGRIAGIRVSSGVDKEPASASRAALCVPVADATGLGPHRIAVVEDAGRRR
jgi:hypothetical protein